MKCIVFLCVFLEIPEEIKPQKSISSFLLFLVWREKKKKKVYAPSIFEWPTTATAQGHAHKPKQIHAKHPQFKMHAQTHIHCIFRHFLSLSLPPRKEIIIFLVSVYFFFHPKTTTTPSHCDCLFHWNKIFGCIHI